MPRQKVSYKTKKKHHSRNQFTRRPVKSEVLPTKTQPNKPAVSSRPSKKLSFDKFDHFVASGSGNLIFDITLLSEAIGKFVKCKFCNQTDSIELVLCSDDHENCGLFVTSMLKCTYCQNTFKFKNSKTSADCKLYDINMKFVFAMRTIGKGPTAGNELCVLLDLPKPPQKFDKYTAALQTAVKAVAEDSMMKATEEAVQENDGCRDIAVAVDGSWQKRGFKSLNGLVSVTSFDTGKVINVSVLSKYCQECTLKTNTDHKCTKNYDGSLGGMEVAGALEVFRNSVSQNVRYTRNLGDGDSKGCHIVNEAKSYGDEVTIEKLECIGHIQKRMGSRLRELKRKMKGTKLDDGKVLGGKKRLTDAQVDKLQTYYGLAIRRGVKSVEEMQKNIWATYFHKLSTNKNPQHGLCPKGADSWCGYEKGKAQGTVYEHKDSLPEEVMLKIKDIYRALTNSDLLKKCLHGHTQNPNESFNNVVWSKIPKRVFVRLDTFKLGVYDAIVSFNDGQSGKLEVYRKLGLSLCERSVSGLRRMDDSRQRKSEKAAQEITKEARQERRKRKLVQDEKDDQKEGPQYGPGLF